VGNPRSEATSFAVALEALWEHEPSGSMHPATLKAEKARVRRMRRHAAVAGFGTVVAFFLLATCALWGYILWLQADLEVCIHTSATLTFQPCPCHPRV